MFHTSLIRPKIVVVCVCEFFIIHLSITITRKYTLAIFFLRWPTITTLWFPSLALQRPSHYKYTCTRSLVSSYLNLLEAH